LDQDWGSRQIPRRYDDLEPKEQEEVVSKAGKGTNWFRLWLKLKAEALFRDKGSVSTKTGIFERMLEELD
jgi:hypothetical protein